MQITTTNRSGKNLPWKIYKNVSDQCEMEIDIAGVSIKLIVSGKSVEIITDDADNCVEETR